MSLRAKLTLLLLLVGLVPLGVVAWIASERTGSLGEKLATRDRDRLENQLTLRLQNLIETAAASLNQDKIFVETAVIVQTQALERQLARLDPLPDTRAVFEGAMGDLAPLLKPSLRHFRDRNGASPVPLAVTESLPLFRGDGTDEAERAMADRLAGAVSTLKALNGARPDLLFWQVAAFEEGLAFSFPGRSWGGLPDPRTSVWYRTARQTEASAWTAPFLDAATGQLVLAVARPIHDRDGEFRGATAILIRILPLLERGTRAGLEDAELARSLETFVVDVAPGEAGEARSLRILVGQTYAETGTEGRAFARLSLPLDDDRFDLLADDMAAGLSGIRRLPFEGRDSIWAFAPLDGLGTQILAIAPFDSIDRQLRETADVVRLATTQQLVGIASVSLVVALAAIAAVLLAGRMVTLRLQRLDEATRALAEGDLNARAEVGGKDELASLARTFNDMVPRLKEHLSLRQHLGLAQEVQQALLPDKAPDLDGWDMAGTSLYCDETGGDYYDFQALKDGRLAVALGDVTGHGLASALTMTGARASFQALVSSPRATLGPGHVLTRLNGLLARDATQGRFMTFCLLYLEPESDRVVFANAGGDPILHGNAKGCTRLDGGDPPLGIDPDLTVGDMETRMVPGDLLLLATDGATETRNEAGEMFGRDRIESLLRDKAEQDAGRILNALVGALEAHRGEAPRQDDVTLVVIKRRRP
ncbi:MAG: SpoIIE family protein phosphatase [Rhodospirillales bacterium]